MREKLFEAAKKARLELESGEVDKKLLVRLYREYNPQVQDVESFISDGLEMFPRLCCGIASSYLKHALGGGEITVGTYNSENHTFLVLEESVIDITSDQYGGPSIYVGDITKPWSIPL